MKKVTGPVLVVVVLIATAMQALAAGKRAPTVEDSISLTKIGEEWDDLLGRDIAHYSADGRKFVVVTRTPSIDADSIHYVLSLFRVEPNRAISAPQVLAENSATSNSPGISDITWLNNDEVLFLAAQGGMPVQLRSVSVSSGIVRERLAAPTSIAAYGVGATGTIVALIQPPPIQFWNDKTLRNGLVISNELLSDLFAGHAWEADDVGAISPFQVKVVEGTGALSEVPMGSYKPTGASPVVAPDGRHSIMQVWVDKATVNEGWERYRKRMARGASPAALLLADHRKLASHLLLDAPVSEYLRPTVVWTSNSTVVIANTYLPVSAIGSADAEKQYAVEVDVSSGAMSIISQGVFQFSSWDSKSRTLTLEAIDNFSGLRELIEAKVGARRAFRKGAETWIETTPPALASDERPRVVVRQDIDQAPILVAEMPDGSTSTLLDTGKQLDEITLASVEEISWRVNGNEQVTGGLYLPLDYKEGGAYPLVVQTHGWLSKRFSMDGVSSAGYSAQALAAKGFVVLQVPDLERWDGTADEGPRNMEMYESGVDALRSRGLIDPGRIGILGWSRTGYHVRYALTFSRITFGAAVIADGMDGSYGQYLAYLNSGQEGTEVYEAINGGIPFAGALKNWAARATGFNLDRVRTPVRLLTFTTPTLLCNWEWFVGLRRMGIPVEHVWLKDAAHAPIKPSHRLVAQKGTVQWFDFWLNGREHPDADPEQYRRWRALRSAGAPILQSGS